jgi:hypothetical protein
MKNSFLTLFLVFFIVLSGLYVWKYFELRDKYALISERVSDQTNISSTLSTNNWLQSVELNEIPEKSVIIFVCDSLGCGSCLIAESAEWQQWLDADTTRPPSTVVMIVNTKDKIDFRKSMDALGVKYKLDFDDAGKFVRNLNVTRSPEVFFCYKGHVIQRYFADINDRERTKIMQEKFAAFLNLK